MEYFAPSYDVVDDYLFRHGEHRDDHPRHAREAHERGEISLPTLLPIPSTKPC